MIKRKKVLVIFGTRPEAIKMAPVCHVLAKEETLDTIICVSGQHREMLDQVLSVFEIVPNIDLNLMSPGKSLSALTADLISSLGGVISSQGPDLVLVHGDTATAMAGAIAAFMAGVPVAHVEAGLRTYDLRAPFPEEFNRQSISLAATLHFAPTQKAADNLSAERTASGAIMVTGNTVIDALHLCIEKLHQNQERMDNIYEQLVGDLGFEILSTPYVLITGHRRENFGSGFQRICKAISALANAYPQVHFVYPVHLNPQVIEPVKDILGNVPNVHLIDPLGYEPFVCLLKACLFVMTDSGGIQEEAPSLRKPVLVMRETTERPEGLEAGTLKLVGSDTNSIFENAGLLIENPEERRKMGAAQNPFGDGRSSRRILEAIKEFLYE